MKTQEVAVVATLVLIGLTKPSIAGSFVSSRAETLITGCELILHGREVPLANRNGIDGYWVVRDDTSVTVNGILCVSVSTYFRKVEVPPDTERASQIIERAARQVLLARDKHTGNVVVDNVISASGESFEWFLPEEKVSVSIVLEPDEMLVRYEKWEVRYLLNQEFDGSMDSAGLDDRIVDTAFRGTVRSLRSGHIVLKGRGYEYSYPLSRAKAVRSAIDDIRSNARVDYVDTSGRPVYGAVQTTLGLWVGSCVTEIMESR
jgi:hypothetical protein